MLVEEYIQYDVHELAALIKSGRLSATEAIQCAIDRGEEVNPKLNAVIEFCPDFAKQCLANMSGNEPYYGVPLLVKDLGFTLKGLTTTEGSRFFASNQATANSDLIDKLINLGFVPIGQTNTPELGLSFVTESVLFGPCHNPFDLSRTSGGSSGGSAAAVASGVTPIATASDGGGSIRIPAACCGLFGFKPTTGLMPTGPWVGEQWSGMATSYILARSVDDTAQIFSQLIDTHLEAKQNTKLRVSYLDGAFSSVALDPSSSLAVKKVEQILVSLGHTVDRKSLTLDLDAIGECAMCLIAANTCAAIKLQEQHLGRKASAEELEPVTWEFYRRGELISAHELINTKDKLYQLMRPLHQLLQQTDVVLTPALAQLPLKIGSLRTDDDFERYLQKNIEFSPFTSLFNQAGLPAMTIPVMLHDGLPVSVQFGAAKGRDLDLLNLAQELATQLPKCTPKIS